MNAEDVIRTEQIFLNVPLATKDDVLTFVAEKAKELGITDDASGLRVDLVKREGEMATGLEGGYAIPHAKSDHVRRTAILYISVPEDLAWGSFEGSVMVRRMFALLVPKEGGANVHLELLSQLAVGLIEESFRAQVEAAQDAESLCAVLRAQMSL